MLVPLLAALALAQSQSNQTFTWYAIPAAGTTNSRVSYAVANERLDPPKYSPKKFGANDPQPFEFDWLVAGYGKMPSGNNALRFRVFSQERKAEGDPAPAVCRMLLQIWDLMYRKYSADHSQAYDGIIDVYLCWGGKPGGEQRFDIDVEGKPPRERKANTIYIYDLSSFTNPVEMAREVAHEYGHAVLPAVGGFVTPEDWGNGVLGERLFLRWCRDQLANGNLQPADVMGATKQGLDGWVAANVEPWVIRAATNGPEYGLLEGKGQIAMDVFTGLVLYADSILPPSVVSRSFRLIGSTRAQDYPQALVQACKEKEHIFIEVPSVLKGKKIWVPLADGKVSGAQLIKRAGDWALVEPGLSPLTLTYPK